MTDENLRERVRAVFAQVCRVEVEQLHDDLLVREELGIDSLLGLQLLAQCEQKLGIDIDEAGCAELETVGEFVEYFLREWQLANN